MIERVRYTPEAGEDIAVSYDWYENREPGLGEEFLRCVEACALTIQRHPHMFPEVADKFRRAPIRRFPFEVFHETTDDCVTIHAVFHCSQNPQKWRRRIDNDL